MMKKELQDCMTSELLFQAMQDICNEEDKKAYIAEYDRRLRMMGLTAEQIEKFKELDESAINNGCYIRKEILLATQPMIKDRMTVESIKLENCTFSELVYLTDDANAAFFRDHEWLSSETWNLVFQHALNGDAKAAWENLTRMQKIGISQKQNALFSKNECMIALRLRWKRSEELAW